MLYKVAFIGALIRVDILSITILWNLLFHFELKH